MTKFKEFGSDNWVQVFPKWHEIIGKMYNGLNWHASERDLLEFMREEIMLMVDVIDRRLAELDDSVKHQ